MQSHSFYSHFSVPVENVFLTTALNGSRILLLCLFLSCCIYGYNNFNIRLAELLIEF